MGDDLREIESRLPTPDEQRRRAEQFVASIQRRVDDAKLRASPCLKVAWAIVEGRVKRIDVELILDGLDQLRRKGTLRKEPGAYFTGGAKKLFARKQLDWDSAPRRATE